MKKTIIVMPIANEELTIEKVITEIMDMNYKNLYVYTIIDDYSKDETENIIKRLEAKYPNLKLIHYTQSTGVVSCYLEGFRNALLDGAEQIIEMDGGGSHLPHELPLLIDKLNEGYDCVWGSRYIRGGGTHKHPLYRKFLSSAGTILANLVLGTKLKDMTSGFEGFQSYILKDLNLNAFLSTGHMYQTEMRFYCRKYKTVEVPINYIGSKSSLKLKSVVEALKILFLLKQNERNVKIRMRVYQ